MSEQTAPPRLFAKLQLRVGSDGLVPAVIQDAVSGDVLMVAFMNEQALAATFISRRAHFWSRSRKKLWRKGETSGHEQIVEAVYVNCESNCLLVSVNQIGAVCHDGYPTCFYRRVEPDGRMAVVRQQVFNPAEVYVPLAAEQAAAAAPPARVAAAPKTKQVPESSPLELKRTPTGTMPEPDLVPTGTLPMESLEHATRLLYGALQYLRENDLTSVSKTSQRLRRGTDTVSPRVADELRELAGVLDQTHGHTNFKDDAKLESVQVVYWALLSALRAGVSFDWLRPDLALATIDHAADLAETARRIRSEARRWERGFEPHEDHGINCHAALVLVGQACHVVKVSALSVIEADLAEMRSRGYLASYFAEHAKSR